MNAEKVFKRIFESYKLNEWDDPDDYDDGLSDYDASCSASSREIVEFEYKGHKVKCPVVLSGSGTARCTYYQRATYWDPSDAEYEYPEWDEIDWEIDEDWPLEYHRVKEPETGKYKTEYYLDEDDWFIDDVKFSESPLWKEIKEGKNPDIDEEFMLEEDVLETLLDKAIDEMAKNKGRNVDVEID